VTDYYSKMTHYADELATFGAPLHGDELVAYLLAGWTKITIPCSPPSLLGSTQSPRVTSMPSC
jgi:hypothetical protein